MWPAVSAVEPLGVGHWLGAQRELEGLVVG